LTHRQFILGASSTSGDNIQLDLSDSFQNVYSDFRYNFKTGLLRLGVSFSLVEFTAMLRNMKMFLPHGQCLNVHLGGHVQTGGYGMIIRSFGLLSDHVEGFEIVLANGKLRKIWKPQSDEMKQQG
jgi:FAD/FMN-containing dehydrogenase